MVGEETKSEIVEEIKEQEPLRRWSDINFARRIRRMADCFVRDGNPFFGLRVRLDEVKMNEVLYSILICDRMCSNFQLRTIDNRFSM